MIAYPDPPTDLPTPPTATRVDPDAAVAVCRDVTAEDRPRRPAGRSRPDRCDRGSSPVELAVIMVGVVTLLGLVLAMGMRWLAAQAALAAAQRALEIAQAPDGLATDAAATADRLARSSKAVTDVTTTTSISTGPPGDPATVTVTVSVTTVLGTTVSRSASGPALNFMPQRGPHQEADGAVASTGQGQAFAGAAP
ncbi:hypothetical protein [Parafrankia sp. EUN1f]|uniref:hypothetical protein n=1 Tax=Parafrankia sp. EUN1f TaxID=102897 RepID=UPI0001C45201|nr:hypothetical protein [Parafrankia sp. EUN1f]EFC82844.1 hypothetical protein FrEUN1fDRAFT_4041 [Parafrankia sp. EUN1f]